MFLELIAASLVVMLGALIGVITVWKQAGRLVEKNLSYLTSFAAGVFFVLIFFLSEEVLLEAPSLLSGLFWIILGLIAVWIIVRLIPEGHHHYEEDGEEHAQHHRIDTRKLLIGDSLHNIGDGILLAAAFMSSSVLGIAAAASILVHELVQEISEFFILRQGGYSTRGALKINFATASTILIGSIGGYFFLEEFSALEIPVLGLATGALLALLLQDLIPHSISHARGKKGPGGHLLAILIGGLLMFSVVSATADTHIHGDDDHHDEEYLHEPHDDHDHEEGALEDHTH